MANEAKLLFETELPVPMTVANGTQILKGASLTLTDPFTASTVTLSGVAVAGIAKSEKIASDGVVKLAVYRGGYFIVTASGAVTVGEALISNPSNKFAKAEINSEHVAGLAMESATDDQTFLMELKPMNFNLV